MLRLFAAIFLIVGCADEGAPPVLDETVTVVAGTFVEANFEMTEGDLIMADFDADGVQLTWDVHTHFGRDFEQYVQGQSSADSIEFLAGATQTYSFYWLNLTALDAALTVNFDIPEGTTFDGWFSE